MCFEIGVEFGDHTRYEDLRQSSGITNATLSDRLKHLEDNDLIARRQYQSNPTRDEYVLTRKGSDTRLLTQALVQIGDKWAVAPPLSRVAVVSRLSRDRAGKAVFRDFEIADLETVRALLDN